MPYLNDIDRQKAQFIEALRGFPLMLAPGHLSFCVTMLIKEYLKVRGGKLAHYWVLNDVLGALEDAKLEYYRRIMADHADRKIKENGDVYGDL